jgi:hypothetical protein
MWSLGMEMCRGTIWKEVCFRAKVRDGADQNGLMGWKSANSLFASSLSDTLLRANDFVRTWCILHVPPRVPDLQLNPSPKPFSLAHLHSIRDTSRLHSCYPSRAPPFESLLPHSTRTPNPLQKAIPLRQPIQTIIPLGSRPDKTTQRIHLILARVAAVVVNFGDGDLDRGVVFGFDYAVRR